MSLDELFSDAAARPAQPVDVDELWRHGRRRRRAGLAGSAAAALAGVAAVAALAVPNLLLRDVDRVGLTPAGPAAAWDDLTLTEALDRLIAVNRAQPPLAPTGGDVRISTHLWASRDPEQVPSDQREPLQPVQAEPFVVFLNARAEAPDGALATWVVPVAEDVPEADVATVVAGADLETLQAQQRFETVPVELDDDGESVEDEDGFIYGERSAEIPQLLEEAEALAADPRDERVIEVAMSAIRGTVPAPQDRARALEILRRLDPAPFEYRGVVRDLLGREGVAIATVDQWGSSVMIFSPDSGALLQEEFSSMYEGAPATSLVITTVEERVVQEMP